jgi:two-component system chemotaxis response regulator CheB
MVAGPEQLRVLVVSASPYTRYVISGELSSASDIFVVGTARTADEIAQRKAMLRPDLAFMDLESPRELIGLQRTLEAVEFPVLVSCSQSPDGAKLALSALEAGAVDVVARSQGGVGEVFFTPNLLSKVRELAGVKPCNRGCQWPDLETRTKASRGRLIEGDRLVVVSASVGGIGPLVQLLAALRSDLRVALLVLSSLPACYVRWFVRRVGPLTAYALRQAQDGLDLKRGLAYVAPHDYPLTVQAGGFLTLDRGLYSPSAHASADATLASAASQYGPEVLAVVLSGVGRDGVQGALRVRNSGGHVIVQDTATCLADETPQAVIDAGAASAVVGPERIAAEIARQVAPVV